MSTLLRRVRLWSVLGLAAAPWLAAVGLAISVAAAVLAPLATLGVGRVVDGLGAGDADRVASGLWLVGAGIVVAVLQSVSWPLVWFFVEDLGERYAHHHVLRVIAGIPTIAHHEMPEMADRVALVRRHARQRGNAGLRLSTDVSAIIGTVTLAGVLASVAWWLTLLIPAALFPAWASGRVFRARMDAERDNAQTIRVADRLLDIARDPGTGIEVRCSGAPAALLEAQDAALDQRLAAVAGAARRTRTLAVLIELMWIAVLAVSLLGVFTLVRAGSAASDRSSCSSSSCHRSRRGRHVAGPGRVCRADVPAHRASRRGGAGCFRWVRRGERASHLVSLLAHLRDPTTARSSSIVSRLATSRTPPGTHGWSVFQDHAPRTCCCARPSRWATSPTRAPTGWRLPSSGRTRPGWWTGSRAASTPSWADSSRGGTELSGGQWQRLAIARGMLRDAPLLMLLDEPSSALDAQAEDVILGGYVDRARDVSARTGGITVIVSHRMSTVRAADRVIHLVDGRVAEDGTHDELMTAGGAYAELFELQARAYR